MKSLQLIKRECLATAIAFADGLLSLGILNEDELSQLLLANTNYKRAEQSMQDSMWDEFDADIFLALHCVPLSRHEKTLTVGMIDPTDFALREQLIFFTGLRIKPAIMKKSEIENILKKVNPQFEFLNQGNFEIFVKKFIYTETTEPKNNLNQFQNFQKPKLKHIQPVLQDELPDDIVEFMPEEILEEEPLPLKPIVKKIPDKKVTRAKTKSSKDDLLEEYLSEKHADLDHLVEIANFEGLELNPDGPYGESYNGEAAAERSIDALFENLAAAIQEPNGPIVEDPIDHELATKLTSTFNRLLLKINSKMTAEKARELLTKNMDFEVIPYACVSVEDEVRAGWREHEGSVVFATNLQLSLASEREYLGALEGNCAVIEKKLRDDQTLALILMDKRVAAHEVLQDLLGKLLEKLKGLK